MRRHKAVDQARQDEVFYVLDQVMNIELIQGLFLVF